MIPNLDKQQLSNKQNLIYVIVSCQRGEEKKLENLFDKVI